MSFGTKLFIFSVLTVGICGLILYNHSRTPKGKGGDELFMYCAAGVKPPVLEAAREFEKRYHVRVQLQYGGSGTLLSSLQASKTGDLYLAADKSYTDIADRKGVLAETLPIAHMTPVIAVRNGNPKGVKTAADLARNDIRVALGNPEAASIGRQTRKLLTKTGHWDEVKKNVTDNGVFKPTVPEVANDIKLGAVDTGVVWDATANQYPEIEAIHLPEFDKARKNVTVGVLKFSKNPTLALRFARFLNSKIGNEIFTKNGYDAVAGDDWAWKPEITFYAGSVNRRAIEKTLKKFAEREGVTINTVYNGCGILTGQMKSIRQGKPGDTAGFPDAYMACDRYYLDNVQDWFQEDIDVSAASIVLVVQKGNPSKITGLKDLTRQGLRIAVGQPDQCTVGALSRALLKDEGLYDQVMPNVVTQTASSSLLLPTVTTKSVDVAIAYKTDAVKQMGKIEIIPIASEKARAIQPYSIATSTNYKHLCRRLKMAIVNAREDFEDAGFTVLTEAKHKKIEK